MEGASRRSFAVVVPFYNEERGIHATLDALARQSDGDFSIILVDNASTDGSSDIARAFAARIDVPSTAVVVEHQKGTGAAADTGVRAAIAAGATHVARTDADCVPGRDWIRNLKRAMYDEGLEFVAGKIRPREDEGTLTLADRVVLPGMIWIAENFGRIHRRGPQFKYPYFMAAGNNLAITAELYVRSGGFPRTAIEHAHEDRMLSETVRTLTTRAGVRRDVVVYNSVRRVRAYGYIDTLRWYRNHGNRPDVVDIR
jgi:glycosyltransferase involved in cell wall biosynthesis